jgi:hypothetical protein
MMSKLKENIDLFKLNKLQLIKKINSLELHVEELEDTIKDELYKTFMGKLQEPQELNRYKKENTNLRKKIKILKNLLKGEK